ncbi:unnamed protein product [Diatraea saccharalis]|uniref:Uncharacterized protein n=1 Tax=Diatraea saccharalis TaxID=40085 RepID=A0A9N9RC63_9NEOP|nr:unnamed protein product [Diatraea saccharalis]
MLFFRGFYCVKCSIFFFIISIIKTSIKMDETAEFDASIGGTEHLPYTANTLKFAASRSIEIAAMTESILRPSKTKLIFQNLPVHMRRRVMSHNAKRLPNKLRAGHLEQLKKSGLPPKQKRPSRKYRRRPSNLLEEYNRRQKNNIWLETHIWHAKRFHMIERWGYRMAYAPCDKAFRACYRATSAHCLIQDISYYTPVHIMGQEAAIKELFSSVTSNSCGLGICAKAYTDGKREGSIHLYEKNTYPFSYIGKLQFIWDRNDKSKSLWLFVHPSQIKQVELLLTDLINDTFHCTEKRRKLMNNFSENVKIKFLPLTFNRFRMTGPKSHAVLAHSIKCIDNLEKIKENKWIKNLKLSNLYLNERYNYWQNIKNATSPSQIPSNVVVGLVVRDPRLCRPKHRTKSVIENISLDVKPYLDVPTSVSSSPLWDCDVHDSIKKQKLSNTQFIEHITKTQLVPGEINIDDPILQSIPIVLIQRPGSQHSSKKIGYGSGWDIIIPPGYGLQFWQTFIMFGARSGGHRESEHLALEMGDYYLPPDSKSGKEEEKRIETELRNKYFRLPPSKRVNYRKLGIVTPFICPWKILLTDWSDSSVNDFFVLRDRKLLQTLQDCIINKKKLPQNENTASCLVPVYLKIAKKGNLKQNAIICMPEEGDLLVMPQELPCEDPNEKIRKQKRIEHRRQLKQLKRRRNKLKKAEKQVCIYNKSLKCFLSFKYVKVMRELWLPSNIKSCRYTCSRQILGFLPQAGYSFSESRSCGVGFIAFNALNTLLMKKLNQVLVRNVSSKKYRLANICLKIDQ